MANNTNAQAIVFDNTRIRPMADLLNCAYQSAKSVVSQWNGQNVVNVIPNDANLIQDGATVASGSADGRPPITNAQATAIITRCQELINWMERGTLDTSGTQNNATLNTVVAVKVNGKATL